MVSRSAAGEISKGKMIGIGKPLGVTSVPANAIGYAPPVKLAPWVIIPAVTANLSAST